MQDFYISQTKESLKQDLEIITFEINKNTNLDTLANKFKNRLNTRITIVDIDGNIIAESHKDKSLMEDHKYRPEIMQANSEDYGYKIRYSHTVKKNMLYIAKKYTYDGTTLYIRLSKEIKNINKQILSLGIKILGVVILFFIATFTIVYKMNLQLQHEIQKIANFLRDLAGKKKPNYINSDFSQEFALITKLLTKISQILIKREKQKSKYTNKLEASNNQKDDIISAISHEFKNPIAVINGYSQTLLDDVNINSNIRIKFLKKIHNNGNKLSDLIDTLRLSLKLDNGQMSINLTDVNLFETVKDSVDNLKLHYPKREIVIHSNEDISLKVDRSLFCVLITNLVENALKYSEDEVNIYLMSDSIEVVDTGIGISKANLQKITDKFYRVHENSWNNSLGLGLFIVNTIITLHNFTLQIESKEHSGSTFRIKF